MIGGGEGNNASGTRATIAGGLGNTAGGSFSTVGRGTTNTASGSKATIGGGDRNFASNSSATVGGGILNTASGEIATIGGGNTNLAPGVGSTVGGGFFNTASGEVSTVPGGWNNKARGPYSFASGYNAKALHEGAFAWSDRSQAFSDSLISTGDNQFLIRAAGGVGIGTNAPAKQLSVDGSADISDSLGIGTSSLEAQLHVQVHDLGVGSGDRSGESILVERNDAIVGAYSSDAGDWGSGIVLAEMEAGTLRTKWAIVRETNNIGDDLHFKYGTATNHNGNATRFEITNDGRVISHGIRPFSDNGGTSGDPSFRWADVYATNGVTMTSDRRLKQDIEDLDNGLSLLSALRPVRYRWKSDPDGDLKLGLIAQEVESIVPEVVRTPENDTEHYGMNYAELVPLLIKAIQEQQATIETLRAADGEYDRRLAELEARLQP